MARPMRPSSPFGQAVLLGEPLPGLAAVVGDVEAGARTAGAEEPGPAAVLPHRGEQLVRDWTDRSRGRRAGALVDVEDLAPGLAAVVGLEDAALRVLSPDLPHGRDPGDVRDRRGWSDDAVDALRLLRGRGASRCGRRRATCRCRCRPRRCCGRCLRRCRPRRRPGSGWIDGDRADRGDRLIVEDRLEREAAVDRLPERRRSRRRRRRCRDRRRRRRSRRRGRSSSRDRSSGPSCRPAGPDRRRHGEELPPERATTERQRICALTTSEKQGWAARPAASLASDGDGGNCPAEPSPLDPLSRPHARTPGRGGRARSVLYAISGTIQETSGQSRTNVAYNLAHAARCLLEEAAMLALLEDLSDSEWREIPTGHASHLSRPRPLQPGLLCGDLHQGAPFGHEAQRTAHLHLDIERKTGGKCHFDGGRAAEFSGTACWNRSEE